MMKSVCRKTAVKLRVSMADARALLPMIAGCKGIEEYFGFSEEEAAFVQELYAGAPPKPNAAARKRK